MSDVEVEQESDSNNYRNILFVESIIFAATGVTSFLSMIFIPRNVIFFFTLAILNGLFSLFSGIFGFFIAYHRKIQQIIVLWGLNVVVFILNMISSGSAFYLLIIHIKNQKPDCEKCSLDQFLYVLYAGYFCVQVVFDIGLAVLALYEIKHSYLFKVSPNKKITENDINKYSASLQSSLQ
jgi:hypothetical protein